MPGGRVLVIRRFSFGTFSFSRVLDSRCFIKQQVKVFRILPFTNLYESYFVQIFETNGHHSSSKTFIGISKVRPTSKRRSRFLFGVKFEADVIIRGAEAEGVTVYGEEVKDMITVFKRNVTMM